MTPISACPEVRVGIPLGHSRRAAPRLIGWVPRRWLVMTAEISTHHGAGLGLVDVVAPQAASMPRSRKTVAMLLECGPSATRGKRALLRQWEELPLKQSMTVSSAYSANRSYRRAAALMQGFIDRKR